MHSKGISDEETLAQMFYNFWLACPIGGPSGDGRLLEDGDYRLLENGDFRLLESG